MGRSIRLLTNRAKGTKTFPNEGSKETEGNKNDNPKNGSFTRGCVCEVVCGYRFRLVEHTGKKGKVALNYASEIAQGKPRAAGVVDRCKKRRSEAREGRKKNRWNGGKSCQGGGRSDPRKELMKELLLSFRFVKEHRGTGGYASATGNNVVSSGKGETELRIGKTKRGRRWGDREMYSCVGTSPSPIWQVDEN
jgi:hypothetical protein